MCVAPLLLVCLRRFAYSVLFIAVIAQAQSINISNFYYRDYLDFGQNKGAFSGNGSTTITGKDGTEFTIPQTPNFSASSNNGNLTAVGRGFAVTANHVTSPEQPTSTQELRRWGLTLYTIAKMDTADGSSTKNSVSKPYGRDEKFLRFDKYVVEGQVDMLNIDNSEKKDDTSKDQQNIAKFKEQLEQFKDDSGNIYIYQAGSGVIDLRNNSPYSKTDLNRLENGETKGGGFAILNVNSATYYNLINCNDCQDLYGDEYKPDSRGITFTYNANTEGNFNNRITSGDSGSGIYAYDKANNKWILLGVTSSATKGSNQANIAAVSNKDLLDFQKQFEQKINLKIQDPAYANTWTLNGSNLTYQQRGDTPKDSRILQNNKDIIFSGGGTIEVQGSINRNMSGYAGGFVFEKADTKTTYKFTNANGQTYSFIGSGLDIGENVVVEWHLRNGEIKNKNNGETTYDSLHKIGKGELIVKTQNSTTTGLGTLKIGEGKVTLNTNTKAFDNIYITSGRGELALVKDRAEALGATKNGTTSANTINSGATSANSYKLAQENTNNMGFYFGKGGGKFDLAGNSLVLNTIAANDSGAIITSTSTTKATLEIQGLGYDSSGNKKITKENTIIHASIGDSNSTNSANQANIDIIHNSDTKNDSVHLIFDGNINTSGKLSTENSNIALQGHATTHATISSESIRNQITKAEQGTSQKMPDYMDLSKPSTLNQPDWDNRTFKLGGIDLKGANLTLGRNASLESNITLDSTSKVEFGGSVKHFIDNKDGKNVTGSGFSYQQEVESGNLSEEMQKIANETIHYKGKITATGGTIESHILDFNASLDLKSGATLTADYLTIEKSNTIRLENGASASVKTLKLQNLSSDSDLNNIFKNSNTTSGTNPKLKVTEALWFENVSNFDLTKLDSANVQIEQNYDIRGVKSTIKGANKDLSANVSLFEGANLTLQNLTLKNTNANKVTNGTTNTIKNSVYLHSDSKQTNNNTKLTLSGELKAENLDKAKIQIWGKSEISAPKIEFSNVKDGILALDKDSKLTSANGNANVEVSGANSSLKIGILGDKSFDINAQGGSKIILSSLPLQDSEAKNPSSKNVDSSPTAQNDSVVANFSGKISANNSSAVTIALESITASVDLSGSASLVAKNIELENNYNSIDLKGNSTLTAGTITAKNLSSLTLTQENDAVANINAFIFDGGTITSGLNTLIGNNISLTNGANITLANNTNGVTLSSKNISLTSDSTKKSTLKASNLTFNGKDSNNFITLDKDSTLEIDKLQVDSANLTLNFAKSSENAKNLQNINLSNNANLNINEWDFGNATQFSSNGNSRVTFENATYTQNGTPKTISADSTISGVLSLSNVGKAQTTQSTTPNISTDTRFESLKFENKNLSFGEDSKISVSFDSSVKKGESSIKTGDYYKLISAGTITDNRTDKRIDFTNTDFFVVSKFIGNTLYVKFLASAPDSFAELNKNISHEQSRYSEILEALIQANPKDDAIDTATRTDNYSVLDKRIQTIDSDLNEIAQGNKTRQTRNLLFSNDQTINTRISQVRLAQSGRNKHLRFAQNDTMYRIQSLMQGAVRSDAMPSYARERKSDLSNSVWLNVGGGYFGGDSKMHFGATNIGYDRLIYAGSSDILLGAMFGFGGSNAYTGDMTDSAMFYNIGLYLHSIFDSQGGKYGGHEIQSNISFSINDNRKTIESKSAKNTAFGTLFALYYKYNFILVQNDTISHALKPVVVLALGYNRNGAFEIDEYKQATYNSVNFSYGLGVEYNAVMSESFYSLALTLKDMAYSGGERVFMSLSGAQNFIGYSLESAPRFSAEINLIGSHKLTDALYLQYGIAGMLDSGTNYGAKGDIKIGYKF
ncbi:S6 family peptidase [Helicobacter cinaedi]|uniref:S6 family peptidase n=1 Tax=Helicobacter cinaedi TaxID=213 RepID=UPI002D78EC38|nr:S6 family peptidase [Helicobacter cinaedi]